jgi:hypothetical protein
MSLLLQNVVLSLALYVQIEMNIQQGRFYSSLPPVLVVKQLEMSRANHPFMVNCLDILLKVVDDDANFILLIKLQKKEKKKKLIIKKNITAHYHTRNHIQLESNVKTNKL